MDGMGKWDAGVISVREKVMTTIQIRADYMHHNLSWLWEA